MKSIILFRHGKSNSLADYEKDHNRPLDIVGKNEAKKMGLYLSKIKCVPGLVITSTAIRAQKTAEIAINSGDWHSKLQLEPQIYGGIPLLLLDLVKQQKNDLECVCLVGHEPTMSGFIMQSTGAGYIHFPPASMAKIYFNTRAWKTINMGSGYLEWRVSPKNINL